MDEAELIRKRRDVLQQKFEVFNDSDKYHSGEYHVALFSLCTCPPYTLGRISSLGNVPLHKNEGVSDEF